MKISPPHGCRLLAHPHTNRSLAPTVLTVLGQWTEWTTWSECSRTCNHGNQTRSRMCKSPVPDTGYELVCNESRQVAGRECLMSNCSKLNLSVFLSDHVIFLPLCGLFSSSFALLMSIILTFPYPCLCFSTSFCYLSLKTNTKISVILFLLLSMFLPLYPQPLLVILQFAFATISAFFSPFHCHNQLKPTHGVSVSPIFLRTLSYSFVIFQTPLYYFVLFRSPSYTFVLFRSPSYTFVLFRSSSYSFIILHTLSYSFVLFRSPSYTSVVLRTLS